MAVTCAFVCRLVPPRPAPDGRRRPSGRDAAEQLDRKLDDQAGRRGTDKAACGEYGGLGPSICG